MPVTHPMLAIRTENRKGLLITLVVAIVIIFIIFRFLDSPLRTPSAPSGIVSYELAGSTSRASLILGSWGTTARLYAAFGLGFDYLFMLVYAACLSLACLMAASRHMGWVQRLGSWLAWGMLLAALADAVENLSLWVELNGTVTSFWAGLAAACASLKFSLLVLGVLYSLLGWLMPRRNG